MKPLSTLLRNGLPVLLALVAMRALVPMGYMPGSFDGPILELCHDSVPPGFLQSLNADAAPGHHDHHAAHDQAGGQGHGEHGESCDFGHFLSQAIVDSTASLGVLVQAPATPDINPPVYFADLAPRYRRVPRGPPAA